MGCAVCTSCMKQQTQGAKCLKIHFQSIFSTLLCSDKLNYWSNIHRRCSFITRLYFQRFSKIVFSVCLLVYPLAKSCCTLVNTDLKSSAQHVRDHVSSTKATLDKHPFLIEKVKTQSVEDRLCLIEKQNSITRN